MEGEAALAMQAAWRTILSLAIMEVLRMKESEFGNFTQTLEPGCKVRYLAESPRAP